MKTRTIILLSIFLCACSSLKRSHRTIDQSTAWTNQHQFSYSFKEDSLRRYWRLVTDSPFYYHPDHGLWAQSGELWEQGLYQQRALKVGLMDNSSNTQISSVDEKSERKIQYPAKWSFIVLTLLGGYLLYYTWRRIRF